MTTRFIVKYSILPLCYCVMSLAQGEDLIAYGHQCLAQEAQLNSAKLRLEQQTQMQSLNRIKVNQAQESLGYYQNKKADLETSMNECAETTPNSAYCHHIRRQYSELDRLITDQQNALNLTLSDDESPSLQEINQANFHIKQANFLALCRDSDMHYAFIQNVKAYSTVCLDGNNKNTLTCSLF